jgi:hypothetical protein
MHLERGTDWLPEPGGPMPLAGVTVALSISESPDLERLGFSEPHLRLAMIEIARYLLAAGATLAYGGDRRREGYTETLIDLVRAHHRAGFNRYNRVESYLAWPIHLSLKPEQEAEWIDEVRFYRVEPPADLGIDPGEPPAGDDPRAPYLRARGLTAMRERMNRDLRARILLGGRLDGYAGKYPGLVEEAYLSLRENKPVYLLGAYGGCAGALVRALRGETPEELGAAYQLRDARHAALAGVWNREAAPRPFGGPEPAPIDHDRLVTYFREKGVAGLRNGLSELENERLFSAVFLPEAVRLLLKGVAAVSVDRP